MPTPRPKPLDLIHTRAALAEYDASQAQRDAAIYSARTNTEVEVWLDAESEARNRVRRAFHQDTSDRNSLDRCMIVSMGWLREMCTGIAP